MHGREWEVLIASDAHRLPVKINDICRASGIVAMTYAAGSELIAENSLEKYKANDAFTAKIQGKCVIFYRGEMVLGDMRSAVMHEVAHVLCGHTVTESLVYDGRATLWNKVSIKPPDIVEEAADAFAASVLAPSCVLWALKIRKSGDIEGIGGMCKKHARIRAERMEELYEREKRFLAYKGKTCFLLSARERQVYANFSDYISNYRASKK